MSTKQRIGLAAVLALAITALIVSRHCAMSKKWKSEPEAVQFVRPPLPALRTQSAVADPELCETKVVIRNPPTGSTGVDLTLPSHGSKLTIDRFDRRTRTWTLHTKVPCKGDRVILAEFPGSRCECRDGEACDAKKAYRTCYMLVMQTQVSVKP